jgi:hypothetical protein
MDKSKRYRSRAADARRIADGIYNQDERRKIIAIADDYEALALEADVCRGYLRLASGFTHK